MDPKPISGRWKRTVKALASYLGCIAMTLFVTYYLDGTVGIMLTTVLILAFIISLVMTLIVAKAVTVEITADKSAMTKGEHLNCTVTLKNALPLPTPAVQIDTAHTAHFAARDTGRYKGATAGRTPNLINMPLTALHSGAGTVFVRSVVLTDYLGIFTFNIKVPPEQLRFDCAIYPDLPDVQLSVELLRTAVMSSRSDDDEEETDQTAITPTGLPGYDHREYVPGDPIKRINWKLSSKRDIYMVRLDEQIRGSGQVFFLDCPVTEDTDRALTIRDNVIEGALAMLTSVAREGRESVFWYCKDGLWLSQDIHTPADVALLQEELSDFTPSEPPTLIPQELLETGKTPICFTAALGEAPGSAAAIAEQCPEALIICAADAGLSALTADHWSLNKEFDLKKLTG